MEFPKVKILNFGVKLSRSLLNWNNKMFPLFEPFTHSYQNTIPRKFTTFRSVEARKKKPRLKYRFLMEKTDRINLLGSFSSFWVHKLTSLYSVWCHLFFFFRTSEMDPCFVSKCLSCCNWKALNNIQSHSYLNPNHLWVVTQKMSNVMCVCVFTESKIRNRIMQIEWKKG